MTDDGTTGGSAGTMTEEVKRTAQQAQQQVGQQALTAANQQKHQATQNLSTVSQALQQARQQLEDQGQGMAGEVMGRAAQGVDGFTGYLESHDVGEIVGDVERFARRQPGVFLGGAFVLGLALARFLKSSPLPPPPTPSPPPPSAQSRKPTSAAR